MVIPDCCQECSKPTVKFHVIGGKMICKVCAGYSDQAGTMLFQKSHEDPGGTEAHIRDIKSRRWHPTEKRLFYYHPPKTYFLPKEQRNG